MALIYKITNLINDKIYVGKTTKTLEKRFQWHYIDSKKNKCKNRPLYQDINKFGIDNFSIELLEEVENNPDEREIYWIDKLNSRIPNGYNIALGGEGKKLVTKEEENKIIELYNNNKTIEEIKVIVKRDLETISNILKKHNISISKGWEYAAKKIGQYDDNWNLISVYDNIKEVEKELSGGNSHGHISECAKGKRKKAYGYHWKYID